MTKTIKMKYQMNNYEHFYELGKDVLTHPLFLTQKDFYQHNKTTLYDHSIMVAYLAFSIGKTLKLDLKSITRGALLHDFFLYDWHIEGKLVRKPVHKKHGFKHSKYAYENSTFYFNINSKEKDIILKHMFPLNLKPPIYCESWIVNFADDYITFSEVFKNNKKSYKDLLNFIDDKIKTS